MVELGSVKNRINTGIAKGYEHNPHSFHQLFLFACGIEPPSVHLF